MKDGRIKQLVAKLEEFGPPELKGRYHFIRPDNKQTPRSALPVCLIYQPRMRSQSAGNTENEHRQEVTITVITDRNKDLNQDFRKMQVEQELFDLVQGTESDGSLTEGGVLWVLERYEQLGNNLWIGLREDIEVVYAARDELRGKGLYTYEATLTAVLTHQLLKPGINA